MHDFLCSDPHEMKIKALARRAAEFKDDVRGVEKMGWFTEEIRAEARADEREHFSFDLVKKGLLKKDDAAKELNLTPEEFARRAQDAGYTFA